MANDNNRKVLEQLHGLTRAIDQRGDHILREKMDIGFSQFVILSTLFKQPDSSQVAVAACLNLTPPAISRQVEMMLQKGLIASRKNPSNRRQHVLSLTKLGQNTLKKAWQLLDEKFNDIMAVLDKPEQQNLVKTLDQLFQRLVVLK